MQEVRILEIQPGSMFEDQELDVRVLRHELNELSQEGWQIKTTITKERTTTHIILVKESE